MRPLCVLLILIVFVSLLLPTDYAFWFSAHIQLIGMIAE